MSSILSIVFSNAARRGPSKPTIHWFVGYVPPLFIGFHCTALRAALSCRVSYILFNLWYSHLTRLLYTFLSWHSYATTFMHFSTNCSKWRVEQGVQSANERPQRDEWISSSLLLRFREVRTVATLLIRKTDSLIIFSGFNRFTWGDYRMHSSLTFLF